MGFVCLFDRDEKGFRKGMSIYSYDRYPTTGVVGCHAYAQAIIAICLRLLRGTFLERYRGVDTASLPSKGDGWVLDA